MKNPMAMTLFPAILAVVVGIATCVQEEDKKTEWTTQYDVQFQKRKPLLGTEAPVLSAFDEQGNPFSLSSTRGKHTVVVFGCLT